MRIGSLRPAAAALALLAAASAPAQDGGPADAERFVVADFEDSAPTGRILIKGCDYRSEKDPDGGLY